MTLCIKTSQKVRTQPKGKSTKFHSGRLQNELQLMVKHGFIEPTPWLDFTWSNKTTGLSLLHQGLKAFKCVMCDLQLIISHLLPKKTVLFSRQDGTPYLRCTGVFFSASSVSSWKEWGQLSYLVPFIYIIVSWHNWRCSCWPTTHSPTFSSAFLNLPLFTPSSVKSHTSTPSHSHWAFPSLLSHLLSQVWWLHLSTRRWRELWGAAAD